MTGIIIEIMQKVLFGLLWLSIIAFVSYCITDTAERIIDAKRAKKARRIAFKNLCDGYRAKIRKGQYAGRADIEESDMLNAIELSLSKKGKNVFVKTDGNLFKIYSLNQ